MFSVLRDPAAWQATLSPGHRIFLRCALSAVVVFAVVAAVSQIPLGQSRLVIAFVLLTACAWYGGVWPALFTPLLLSVLYRAFSKGADQAFDLPARELINVAAVTLLTTAVAWSGEVRRRAQNVARRQAAQLRAQARAIGLAHIVFRDLDGRIADWNEGAQQLYGWTRAEAEGRNIHELLQTCFPKPLDEINAELLKDGQWAGEVIHSRRDGAPLIIATHWIVYRGEDGRLAGVAEVNNDVTALREAEESVREADRRKDRFLATLAHELRNPLAPIRTGLEVLRMSGERAPDPQLVREIQEMLQRQVSHMVRLIDDLLDVSRINTGKIGLRRERVLLADLVRDAVDSSRPHLDAAGHTLVVTLPEEPLWLDADRARISQVILNLLNNAAKFTAPGGRVTLSAARDGDMAEIRVRDSGVGIAADMLPRVFDLFTQIDNSLERSHGGLGIGLSLARTLVEMHGGTIAAQSAGLGHGSEFVVRLPLLAGQNGEAGRQTPTASPVAAAPRHRILVVDDNQDGARSLSRLLEMQGHECRVASDGPSAIDLAARFRPDIFLLDIGMPEMSGYEVARRIRAMPQLQGAKLIAITGWGQEEDRRRSREAGFDLHLVKPITIDALAGVLGLQNGSSPGAMKVETTCLSV